MGGGGGRQRERDRGSFVGCLTSQQHACAYQRRICKDNGKCCHTEIEVANQICYFIQSRYTDTRPTSPSIDPVRQACGRIASSVQISCLSHLTSMSRPGKSSTGKVSLDLGFAAREADPLPPGHRGAHRQREREREREGGRERGRETDRQTDRQTDR